MGKLKARAKSGGAYFEAPADSTSLEFLSSGCSLLDCVLGGGYVFGRMSNIIGDKSTAKTGLAIEAMASFCAQFTNDDDEVWYREAEGAFDKPYAQRIGLPDRVRFWEDDYDIDEKPLDTIEDIFEDLNAILARKTSGRGLYIVDSLDALSDRAEMERDVGEATYAMNKAKQLSELFRKLVRKLERKRICVLIISQVRDNIGVSFGEKYKRAGGKAMDFYATHCLWLAHVGILTRTVNKIKRPYGVNIAAKCKKNKVGQPFRECEFEYVFNYGIDDVKAGLTFLKVNDRLKDVQGDMKDAAFQRWIEEMSDDDFRQFRSDLGTLVKEVWSEIETTFYPTRRKY